MNFQGLFGLAQGFACTPWILTLASVMSIAAIIERFFTLQNPKEQEFRQMADEVIANQDYSKLEALAQDDSLPQKAMRHGLKHAKAHGAKGLTKRSALRSD